MRYLLVGSLVLVLSVTGCTRTTVVPLTLPHWVTGVQHLDLLITQEQPERRFAIACTTKERDGSTRYAHVQVSVHSAHDTHDVILPQPDIDCDRHASETVVSGVLAFPEQTQPGDTVIITLEAQQEAGLHGTAPREYRVGTDGKLYDVQIRRVLY